MSNVPNLAKVIALLKGTDTLIKSNDEIDGTSDFYRVVLDRGSDDGIEVGTRFILYSLGDELFDSTNGLSLGHFEVVRGEGKADHVQPKMCVVISERKTRERRLKGGAFSSINALTRGDAEYESVIVNAPFKTPKIGDLARLI